MGNPLEPWGIDARGEQLYRTMLRHPGHEVARIASMLGWSADEVGRAALPLARAGLVRSLGGGRYEVSSPDAAIERLVEREHSRLRERELQVLAARSWIPQFAADHLAGETERMIPVSLDLVSSERWHAVLEDLIRTTSGELLAIRLGSRAVTPGLRQLLARQLDRRRPMRTIYSARLLEDQAELDHMRRSASNGERSRVLPDPVSRMVIFGGEAALVAAHNSGSGDADLVVRAPGLVAVLRAYFDRLWAHAASIPRLEEETDSADDRRHVLELLALGVKDESIARHLGVSLRTVRRRVADLLDELGASTRFQAGMEAARRGLV